MHSAYLLKFLIEFVTGVFWTANVTALLKTGATLQDAALVMAFFYFGIALFEVPTGMVADRYGRRKSVISGLLVSVVGFLSLYFGFLIAGAAIAGIGLTLISGAFTAWIYNLAERSTKNFDAKSFFVTFDIFGRFAMIAGAFTASFVLKVNANYLWLVMAVVAALAAYIATLTKPGSSDLEDRHTVEKLQKLSLRREVWENKALVFLLLGVFFFGLEQGIRNTIYQPFVLSIRGGSEFILAYWQASLAASRLLGAFFYRNILIKRDNGNMLMLSSLLALAFAELIASFVSSFQVVWMVWICAIFTMGWFFPLKDAYINGLVGERRRATILSIESMVFQLASAVCCLLLALSAVYRFPILWVLGAFSLMLATSSLRQSQIGR